MFGLKKIDWNQQFRELYDETFPPLKNRYDAVCQIFLDWNTRKISDKEAYKRLHSLGG